MVSVSKQKELAMTHAIIYPFKHIFYILNIYFNKKIQISLVIHRHILRDKCSRNFT